MAACITACVASKVHSYCLFLTKTKSLNLSCRSHDAGEVKETMCSVGGALFDSDTGFRPPPLSPLPRHSLCFKQYKGAAEPECWRRNEADIYRLEFEWFV